MVDHCIAIRIDYGKGIAINVEYNNFSPGIAISVSPSGGQEIAVYAVSAGRIVSISIATVGLGIGAGTGSLCGEGYNFTENIATFTVSGFPGTYETTEFVVIIAAGYEACTCDDSEEKSIIARNLIFFIVFLNVDN